MLFRPAFDKFCVDEWFFNVYDLMPAAPAELELPERTRELPIPTWLLKPLDGY